MENYEEHQMVEIDYGNSIIEFRRDTGILGDPVGYGKTLSVLGLISRDLDKKRLAKRDRIPCQKSLGDFSFVVREKSKEKYLNTTLIIIPHSLANTWASEVKKTSLKYLLIKARKNIPEKFEAAEYDVVIVTNTMYAHFCSSPQLWYRVFIDEPHQISSCKIARGKMLWFITGTPDSLRAFKGAYGNTIKQTIRSIPFFYGNLDLRSSLIVKNSQDVLDSSYKMPCPNFITHKYLGHRLKNIFREFISAEVAIMLSSGDIKGVIERLGGKSEECNLVELLTKKMKRKLELLEISLKGYELKRSDSRLAEQQYQNHLTEYKQAEDRLRSLEQRFQEALLGKCAICYDQLDTTNIVITPCCQNLFDGECIMPWLQTRLSCPYCRAKILLRDLVCVSHCEKTPKAGAKEKKKKDKNCLVNLDKTIIRVIKEYSKKKPNSRFIVCSNYGDFRSTGCFLTEKNISWSKLTGTSSSISKIVEHLASGEIQVLLMNADNFGSGLNLQMVTDILFMHKMSPDIETQVIGRANRIGSKEKRDSPVNVHYFEEN